MLKLTYTDTGLHMERVAIALETLVTQRVVLALRLGQTLHIEPSRAAFLLPADAPGLNQLKLSIRLEKSGMSIAPVDDHDVEICVPGNWIAASTDAQEGTFITEFGDRTELLVYKLWQATQPCVSPLTG